MARSTRIFIGFLVPVFALALGWQLGVRYATVRYDDAQHRLEEMLIGKSQSGATIANPKEDVNIELLWATWRLLLANYLHPEEMDPQKMVEGAVEGMVAGVGDPYTLFMSADASKEFTDSLQGNLEGIGAELSVEGGLVQVVRLIPGSPAERGGLLPKDIITSVNDVDLTDMLLPDVIGLIRGPKGTTARLDVNRAKENGYERKSFAIVRDHIHIPSAEYEEKSGTGGMVGVLTVSQFGSETVSEVREILQNLDRTKLKGLIVDLRYNGGGYLDGAIDLTSMFIPEGRVVTVAGRERSENHDVTGRTILPDMPLVVLINGGSASASEILAGALQDHGRATVVGTQSFGKGTVQEVIDLPGGASLRVTIATWLTPDGTDLGKHGVTPDVIVERTPSQEESDVDPQLEAAMAQLL